MEQKTIRFTRNAVDRRTRVNYVGGDVETLPAEQAERHIAAGVAEEVPSADDLKKMKVEEVEKVAEKVGADLSGAKNKEEKVAAVAKKEGGK